MQGTELREGVHNIISAVSTEIFCFGFRKDIGILGPVGIGKDYGLRDLV